MMTIDLTEYLEMEAEIFKKAASLQHTATIQMRMVSNDMYETLKKNLKKGDRIRMRRLSSQKPITYTFESIAMTSGERRAYLIVKTNCQNRVIPVISEEGELFPGFAEIYVPKKNLKLK